MTPPGPKLDFVGASETVITVAFSTLNSHDIYEIQWKEYPQVRYNFLTFTFCLTSA